MGGDSDSEGSDSGEDGGHGGGSGNIGGGGGGGGGGVGGGVGGHTKRDDPMLSTYMTLGSSTIVPGDFHFSPNPLA